MIFETMKSDDAFHFNDSSSNQRQRKFREED